MNDSIAIMRDCGSTVPLGGGFAGALVREVNAA
jgi:hypothetical protein